MKWVTNTISTYIYLYFKNIFHSMQTFITLGIKKKHFQEKGYGGWVIFNKNRHPCILFYLQWTFIISARIIS